MLFILGIMLGGCLLNVNCVVVIKVLGIFVK
ncbi:hypothetical protein ACOMICROBIO_LKFPLAJE_03374 [Vibrio sp. B1FIG11]|nr:hypothetical protein ACOMICROBIO_LKFPLAJE_03374 [Vibrio sp. B1FIG11]